MPVAIGEVSCSHLMLGAGPERNLAIMQRYLHRGRIVHRRTEERDGVLLAIVTAEPEQQRIVFGCATAEECRLQQHG